MSQFSIILPVKNGSNHIRECISSILAQTYRDFELLILENCSTDDTVAIIQSFKDKRISIFPSEQPLSIEENWARITTIPKSEFITLIGHDDILHPGYLQIMQQLILDHPKASLYQTHFNYIDAKDLEIKKCQPMPGEISPATVVADFLSDKISLMGTGFLMRGNDYDKVGGIPAYPKLLFADMELFVRIALLGYLAVSPKECFSYRLHPGATTSVSSDQAFMNGFEKLVNFFYSIKTHSPEVDQEIIKNADALLSKYCQGISHKVLKTPPSERQTPSVGGVIQKFKDYGRLLKGDDSFDPLRYPKIKMGQTIDNNALYHSLFLLFKRFYKKPVLS